MLRSARWPRLLRRLIAARRRRPPGTVSKPVVREAVLLLLGAGAAYLGAAAFVLSRGTTVAGLVDGVFIRPMKFASAFAGPGPFPTLTVVPAILAVLVALWAGCFKRGPELAAQGAAALGVAVLGMVSLGYMLTGCTPI